jgi:hypothetical protein
LVQKKNIVKNRRFDFNIYLSPVKHVKNEASRKSFT